MINDFLQYLQYEKNYSSHTVLSYRNDLTQLADYIESTYGRFLPAEITRDDLRNWMMQLTESGYSARSIARKFSTLKSFWHFLLLRDLVTTNPTLKILLPKTKKPLPMFFNHREIVQVLDTPFVPDDFKRIRNMWIIELF